MAEAVPASAVTAIAPTPIENAQKQLGSSEGHNAGETVVSTSSVKTEALANTVGKKVRKMTPEMFAGYQEDAGKGSHIIAIKKVSIAIAPQRGLIIHIHRGHL